MIDSIARALVPQKASLEPQKAVTGPGAAVMSWGIPISDAVRGPHQMMIEAQTVYARGNRWVKRAEMTISGRVGGVAWHLETDDGEEITDESSEELKAIRDLFEKPLGEEEYARAYPSQPSTRRAQWGLTSRHMGLCNVGFWHLDELDAAANFPRRIFLIRPDRMTPDVNNNGTLVGWRLDADSHGGGTPLSLEEVLPFYLDQPDKGFFGTGLVESILSTVSLPGGVDRHAIDTLGSGGRLPGIYAPKEQGMGDDVFNRLSSDLRVIKDMPDSSKRDVVARQPIEFTPTSADMSSLNVIELSRMSRDDVLAHWGVPLSTIGGYTPAGMNSGETRKYDEAALWQNAVQFRIDALYETIQYRLLDRLKTIGINVQMVIDAPTFDDDSPKYDLAVKAVTLPLRNVERRAILGLEPLGDDAIDNAIWMPSGIVPVEIEQIRGGLITVDEARAKASLPPMEWDETPTSAELLEQVKAGVLTVDEARQIMGKGPMQWDTTPTPAELIEQVKGGILTVDEARNVMGLGPMVYDETPTPDELMEQLKAGVLTVDEVRVKLGMGPMVWADGPTESDLLEYFKAGVLTADEMREKIGLPAMQWSEELSKEEVDTLNAQIDSGLLTIEEARTQLNRPSVQWPEDQNEKTEQMKRFIDAGFDPADVLRVLGLPPIRHLGLPPITVQKMDEAPSDVPIFGKARLADLRKASARVTPKMEKAVASFLAEQRKEIAARVKAKSDHLAKKPGDTSVWWNQDEWDRRLEKVLAPYASEIAKMTNEQIKAMLEKR